jgi:hypothetical protein
LNKIACPRCKAEILLIPDMRAMSQAINNHLSTHRWKMKKQKLSTKEIQREKEKIERILIENMIKEICTSYEVNESIFQNSLSFSGKRGFFN